MQNRKLALALGLLSATILSAPAGAQTAPQTSSNDNNAPAANNESMTIETVTVTARRRAEDLERVPVAETVVSPDTIRVDDIRTAYDLQDIAPSLTISSSLGSRNDNVFTIRGQSQPFGGADPGVQAYFNEVPFGASGPGNYYDMDNIQVLRGPQGTLFGRNTTGGAVLFEPKKPDDQFGGYIDGQWGDYAMHEVQGALNVPLFDDKLMIRVAGDLAQRDGFTKDVTTNEDLDNVNYDAFRVGVTVKPFDGFENYLAFNYLNNHDNGTGAELTAIAPEAVLLGQYGPEVAGLITQNTIQTLVGMGEPLAMAEAYVSQPSVQQMIGQQAAGQIDQIYTNGFEQALAAQQALGPRKTMSAIPLFYKRHTWSLTDITHYDVMEHLRIRNIFGYLRDNTQPAFEYDGSALGLLEIPNPRTWEQNSRQITEEFQVLGENGDGMFSWIAGFYYEHDYRGGYSEVERDLFGGAANPSNNPLGSTEVDSLSNGGSSLAVYGDLTIDASRWVSGLSFTGGGRFTWDHKIAFSIACMQPFGYPTCQYPLTAASPNPETGAPLGQQINAASFHAPTWNFGVNWQASDDTMLYATYRRGYKSGGFNSGAVGSNYLEFQPEFLTDVEVGTKNNWTILGVPGRTNFDIYYGWYQNIQKNDIVGFQGPVPELPVVLTVNAARAAIDGLELESTFIPNENFQLSLFYSYTEASYDKFILPAAIVEGTGAIAGYDDHAGSPFAYTPKDKLGATGRFHLPIDSSYGMPYFSVTWYWQSKVWFSDLSKVTATSYNPFDYEPDAFQGDYGLINLRLDWNQFLGSSFDASAFVNNVGNRLYQVGANALEHQIGTNASIYGAPRMFGLELRYRFGEDAK
jgi:iron complex outermembrane receptor protein